MCVGFGAGRPGYKGPQPAVLMHLVPSHTFWTKANHAMTDEPPPPVPLSGLLPSWDSTGSALQAEQNAEGQPHRVKCKHSSQELGPSRAQGLTPAGSLPTSLLASPSPRQPEHSINLPMSPSRLEPSKGLRCSPEPLHPIPSCRSLLECHLLRQALPEPI